MSCTNAQQPAQNPTTDSSNAKPTSTATSANATCDQPNAMLDTAATVVTVRPIDCAKRFGGPGTSTGGPRRGAITLVASKPSGLNLGPAITRSRNPSARTTKSHCQPLASWTIESTATPAATTRAAFSFTGFGNAMPPVWHEILEFPTNIVGFRSDTVPVMLSPQLVAFLGRQP